MLHLAVLRQPAGEPPVPIVRTWGSLMTMLAFMSAPGPMELIVILVVALIVLGPKKLPEAARSVGRGMREFKESISGPDDDYDDEPDDQPTAKPVP